MIRPTANAGELLESKRTILIVLMNTKLMERITSKRSVGEDLDGAISQ